MPLCTRLPSPGERSGRYGRFWPPASPRAERSGRDSVPRDRETLFEPPRGDTGAVRGEEIYGNGSRRIARLAPGAPSETGRGSRDMSTMYSLGLHLDYFLQESTLIIRMASPKRKNWYTARPGAYLDRF